MTVMQKKNDIEKQSAEFLNGVVDYTKSYRRGRIYMASKKEPV